MKETNVQQDTSQMAGKDVAELDGITVSPSEVIANMRQLYAQMIGDLTHELCVCQAALTKCEAEKADAIDRYNAAKARSAVRAS